MSINDDYRVITTGRILEGFDPDDVRKHLVSILRLEPDQAEHFFDKPRVLKKGVSWASADKLCNQLAKLGVAAEIQNPAPTSASQSAATQRALQAQPTLELVEDEPESSTQEGTRTCPNCQHVQAKSEQCERCGIYFHKFESTAAPMQPQSPPQVIPAAAPMQAHDSTIVTSAEAVEKGTLSPAAIAAAVVAALVGAWVWRFVAVTFEYEIGFIAWGIGGAVGVAAASAGPRSMQAGVMCAVLALGSIVLGKYWAYNAFVDQYQEAISGTVEVDEEMYAYFEEEKEDARLFARGSGSDTFIRRFMVERGYTYASNPASVSEAELADFLEYVEPELRYIALTSPGFEEWQAHKSESFGEISPWALMREDFGLLDILFGFLGIGTAFRLASDWD